MLKSVVLKFTETGDVELPGQGITIFVGPNNSGKSLVLRELEESLSQHPPPGNSRILKDFEVDWPDVGAANKLIEPLIQKSAPAKTPDHMQIGLFRSNGTMELTSVRKSFFDEQVQARNSKHWLGANLLRFLLIRLDGRTRFELTDNKPMGDLLGTTQNILAQLFSNDELRKEVRRMVLEAFQLYFVIDPTNGGVLRIRLSEVAPGADEQSLNTDARKFHANAMLIKEGSDGVQAYVGIITTVISGQFKIIMVDEPEAFLHPPLARKLGFQLAQTIGKNGGSLFASTHSSDFLMGCVQASKAVRVVRLEYSKGKSRGRVVDPEILESMFRNPLMRSANVISSLFYDGVVVTESDNDRAFYAEIYHRLAEAEGGYPSVLFINAQNKQTIKSIIDPLRKFGVPAAAICDIDILKDGGKTWTGWLKAGLIPDASHGGLALQRDSVEKCFAKAGKDMKADGGVEALPGGDKKAANDLFDLLDQYGIFVVRRGEIEHWLPKLGAVGKKTDWVVSALEKMGSDPKSGTYLKPDAGDVWDFIRKVVKWISDPTRKGAY